MDTLPPLPDERLLIVAPHPDDDVIAAAGIIQRAVQHGRQVQVVFVTDGDNNPWPQRAMERRLFITKRDRDRWGAMRRNEALNSLAVLGVSGDAAVFLGLPDRKMSALSRSDSATPTERLRQVIGSFQPTLILSPSSIDLHADHRAIAYLVHRAVLTLDEACEVATYVVHGEAPVSRLRSEVVLTREEQDRKRRAIECHQSQLLLSRERFLAYAGATERFHVSEHDLVTIESPLQVASHSLKHIALVLFGNAGKKQRDGDRSPDTSHGASITPTYTTRRSR